jgi:hypothetical protein
VGEDHGAPGACRGIAWLIVRPDGDGPALETQLNMKGFGMILEPIVFSTAYLCAKIADKETEMRKRSEGDPL